MRLTLEALTVLDAIERRGSFAAAAEELYRVPSAVTYTIQKLEQDLDIQIFDRSGHRARLTAAGRELLSGGRELLQATQSLESRIQKIATGWEGRLRIAVSDLVPRKPIMDLLEAFLGEDHPTELRLDYEVLAGCWDALIHDRCDLVIGGSAIGAPATGYRTEAVADVAFCFVVAPEHPLAGVDRALNEEDLSPYRVVAVADTSRELPPRTTGIFDSQPILTVANMADKIEAQRRGLGIGSVPRFLAEDDLKAGRLIEKTMSAGSPVSQALLGWRSGDEGRALLWFLKELRRPGLFA